MPKPLRASSVLLCLVTAFFSPSLEAQLSTRLGSEYGVAGALLGDQVFAHASVQPGGGYIVWEDNVVDGNGIGIGARRLDGNLSPVFSSFRVNQQNAGKQEKPQVATLPNGAAGIVWRGGLAGYQHVWFRGVTTNGTFATTNEIRVNTYTNAPQHSPTICALASGNFAVAWGSTGQDGHLQGVYVRLVGPAGQFITAPVQVNQTTLNNQRSPAIAPINGGGFIVTWISERLLLNGAEAHVYARIYDSAGAPVTGEFPVNSDGLICANPAVSALGAGGFTISWSQRDILRSNSWDIFARTFDSSGSAATDPFRVNDHIYGEQFAPRIASLGQVQMVVWTSLGQDGSFEGVFGRIVSGGAPNGVEFRVNTVTTSRQMHPIVVSDNVDRFLAVWTSYVGETGFDLYAQRYSAGQPIPQPAPPYVSALSASRLSVSWPPLAGFPVVGYEIYMDGAQPPAPPTAVVSSNIWTKTGLAPGSTHTFQLAYLLSGGVRSDLSAPASGTTWSDDENLDGLPDDWQIMFWGIKPADWPAGNIDSDGDGASNAAEFAAGTDPTNAQSVLKTWLTRSLQGRRLNWNTQPGLVYQVQVCGAFGEAWTNFGAARFAAGASDSILIPGGGRAGFYRIIRVR